MNIDLQHIMDNEGKELPFQGEFEAASEAFSVRCAFRGTVRNFSGRLELSASVQAELFSVCARCLAPVSSRTAFAVEEIVGQDEVFANGSVLDLKDVIERNLIVHAPMKLLCKEDCAGLCGRCGADLNKGECGCGGDEPDQRLAVLRQLLD